MHDLLFYYKYHIAPVRRGVWVFLSDRSQSSFCLISLCCLFRHFLTYHKPVAIMRSIVIDIF